VTLFQFPPVSSEQTVFPPTPAVLSSFSPPSWLCLSLVARSLFFGLLSHPNSIVVVPLAPPFPLFTLVINLLCVYFPLNSVEEAWRLSAFFPLRSSYLTGASFSFLPPPSAPFSCDNNASRNLFSPHLFFFQAAGCLLHSASNRVPIVLQEARLCSPPFFSDPLSHEINFPSLFPSDASGLTPGSFPPCRPGPLESVPFLLFLDVSSPEVGYLFFDPPFFWGTTMTFCSAF